MKLPEQIERLRWRYEKQKHGGEQYHTWLRGEIFYSLPTKYNSKEESWTKVYTDMNNDIVSG